MEKCLGSEKVACITSCEENAFDYHAKIRRHRSSKPISIEISRRKIEAQTGRWMSVCRLKTFDLGCDLARESSLGSPILGS